MDRLTAMEAFVRVVDAGSFSAAARRWGRSKAVVSKYVAALEAHFGVELLRRTTRSLSLTDVGRSYHEQCVDLLGELESMEASLRGEHSSVRGLLRVTAPPSFAARYLPIMTTQFVAHFPGVVLDLDLTYRMVDIVEEGIDVAIRLTDPRDSSLIVRRIAPMPVLAVASPAYLERRGTPRRPDDLRRHACLIDSNFHDQNRWRFQAGGQRTTVSVSGPFRVNNPTAVRDLAVAGHGIALCPGYVVDDDLAEGRLVAILDGKVAMQWSIYVVYPRRRHLSGRIRAFVDHLTDALGDGG